MINYIRNDYLGLPNAYRIIMWDQSVPTWVSIPFESNTLFDVLVNTPINPGQLLAYDKTTMIWRNYDAFELDGLIDNLGTHIATKDLDMDSNKIFDVASPVLPTDIIQVGMFDHLHEILDINGVQTWINNTLNSIALQLFDEHSDVDPILGGYNEGDLWIYLDSINQFIRLSKTDFTVIDVDTSSSNINMSSYLIFNVLTAINSDEAINYSQLTELKNFFAQLLEDQELEDHTDVVITSPDSYHILEYNGGIWSNILLDVTMDDDDLGNHIAEKNLNMSSIYKIINVPDGALNNDAINKGQLDLFENDFITDLTNQSIFDHTDFYQTSLANNDVLWYKYGKWRATQINTSQIQDDLGNHYATEDLKMSSYKVTGVSNAILSTDLITKGQIDTTVAILDNQSFNSHTDVNVPSPSPGDLLQYSGGIWIAAEIVILGDNLGNHIATQNLVMSNVHKIVNIKPNYDGDPVSDLLTKGYMDGKFNTLSNEIDNQTLDKHTDVEYQITRYNDYILYYNSSQGKWLVGSNSMLEDNLGNHIATQNLDMSGFRIINMGPGTSGFEAVTKYQFDLHTHMWTEVDKAGSKLSDLADVSYTVPSDGDGLSVSGISFVDEPILVVASSEPSNVVNGLRWMPIGGVAGLAAYNGWLLTCHTVGASTNGLANTWVTGMGNVVNLNNPHS